MLFRHTGRAVIACAALVAPPSAHGPLRPDPEALARASRELVERLRADPFAYCRFVNRSWTTRVCAAFSDVRDLPPVHLHGDAHGGQFALTKDAWGLEDFDDSARGPAFVDISGSSAPSISPPAGAAGRPTVRRFGIVSSRGTIAGCPRRTLGLPSRPSSVTARIAG